MLRLKISLFLFWGTGTGCRVPILCKHFPKLGILASLSYKVKKAAGYCKWPLSSRADLASTFSAQHQPLPASLTVYGTHWGCSLGKQTVLGASVLEYLENADVDRRTWCTWIKFPSKHAQFPTVWGNPCLLCIKQHLMFQTSLGNKIRVLGITLQRLNNA